MLVTVAGFVVIFLVGSYNEPAFPHAIVGIVLTTLMIQQFLSGILWVLVVCMIALWAIEVSWILTQWNLSIVVSL